MPTRKCPAGILGINLVIRGQASIYFIRFDQAAGAAKLINEVAGRLKWVDGVPGGHTVPLAPKGRLGGDGMASGSLQADWLKAGL